MTKTTQTLLKKYIQLRVLDYDYYHATSLYLNKKLKFPVLEIGISKKCSKKKIEKEIIKCFTPLVKANIKSHIIYKAGQKLMCGVKTPISDFYHKLELTININNKNILKKVYNDYKKYIKKLG